MGNWEVTDVITTSASQQTRVDFSVSNAKARDEGGRDENCRLRSPCTATKHSHGQYETGVLTEKVLKHEGNAVREFYAALEGPVVVGIEATGAMQWFLELLEQLGIECRVGHPAKTRAAETRKQKHDRRDAEVILNLLLRNRFPDIWMPSTEQRDPRTLLRDRHQWVKMRTRLQHTLQAIALNHALREARALWTAAGRQSLQDLTLAKIHRAKTR